MLDTRIAQRYARALFEQATETKQIDEVAIAVDQLQSLLGSESELQDVLISQDVPSATKMRVLEKIGAAIGVPTLVVSFLGLVVKKGRVAHLATILQTFSDEVARQKGTLIIELSTAVAHNASQQAEIQQRLETRMGSPVRLVIKEDPSLLAGAKIQIGDTVIDSSARQQLRAMKQQLDSVNLS